MLQQAIDFTEAVLTPQNNRESEQILCEQAERLSENCRKIYNALLRGERLTGPVIMIKYGMTEYRRRIKDIKDAGLLDIKERKLPNGLKEWWVDKN